MNVLMGQAWVSCSELGSRWVSKEHPELFPKMGEMDAGPRLPWKARALPSGMRAGITAVPSPRQEGQGAGDPDRVLGRKA